MDGTPVQAKVDITIQGSQPTRTPGTNPTSHATNSRRVRTLTEGETLQSVAYRELGKADATGARSPSSTTSTTRCAVHPGMTLLIPSSRRRGEAEPDPPCR